MINPETLEHIQRQLADYGIGYFRFNTEDIQELLTVYEDLKKENEILKEKLEEANEWIGWPY